MEEFHRLNTLMNQLYQFASHDSQSIVHVSSATEKGESELEPIASSLYFADQSMDSSALNLLAALANSLGNSL